MVVSEDEGGRYEGKEVLRDPQLVGHCWDGLIENSSPQAQELASAS
jgi:hypothetical protein